MNEKRFTIINMGLDGRFIKEDGKIMELERVVDLLNENEQLKQELFESEVDYYKETYHDNPIRAEDHILELKKEFKERFGRDFEYGEK